MLLEMLDSLTKDGLLPNPSGKFSVDRVSMSRRIDSYSTFKDFVQNKYLVGQHILRCLFMR